MIIAEGGFVWKLNVLEYKCCRMDRKGSKRDGEVEFLIERTSQQYLERIFKVDCSRRL